MNRRAALLVLLVGALAAWLVVGLVASDTPKQGTGSDSDITSNAKGVPADPASAPLLGALADAPERTPTATERALVIEVHDGTNPIANATVNQRHYSVPDLMPGRVLSTTNSSGRSRVVLSKDVHHLTFAAPGFLSSGRRIFHAAKHMRVRLWKAPKMLPIVVLDEDGGGLANAVVTAESSQAGIFEWQRGDARGRAMIPIPAFGLIEVTATGPGFMRQTRVLDGADIGTDRPLTMRLLRIPHVASRVLDATSREPLANVEISDGMTSTTSDAEGQFAYQPTRDTITLHLDGYYKGRYWLRPGMLPTEYVVRKTRSPRDHTHESLRDSIAGRVTNPDGSPAEGLVVFGRTSRATTDPEGRYEIPGRPNSLRVLLDGWDLQAVGALLSTTHVRLPPVGRLQGHVAFSEDAARCDVALRLSAGKGPEISAAVPAHGVINVQYGTPDGGSKYVSQPNIWCSSIVKRPVEMDENGTFVVEDIPVGTYTLYVTPDPDSLLLAQEIQVQVHEDASVNEIQLRTGVTMRVRVINHQGQAIAGALVRVSSDLRPHYSDVAGEVLFEGLPHDTEQFIYVESQLGSIQSKGRPGTVVVQYEPRPMLTIQLMRKAMSDGTECTVELSEVDAPGTQRMTGRVVNGEVRARLPSLDLTKSYEVGIKCDTHWSPWTPLSLSADASRATAAASIYLDNEIDEDE